MRSACLGYFTALWLGTLVHVQIPSPDEYLVQARTMAEDHRLHEAAQVLEKGLQMHPHSATLLLQFGSLLVRLGQIERGDALLELALKAIPDNAKALNSRAQAQLNQGNLDTAIELLNKSLWYQPADAETHFRLSFTLFLQGTDSKALQHSQKAVEMDPFASHLRRFYSLMLEVSGKTDEAFHQLRMAFRLDPTNPQTLYRLSRTERRRKSLAQAIEYATLAAELDRENPLYIEELASLYEEIGESESARETRGLASELGQAFDSYLEALKLSEQGQVEPAIKILKEALARQPEFPTGKLLLADLYRRGGRKEESLSLYQQVLEMDPSHAWAREESAWLQAEQGSIESALELLQSSGESTSNQLLLEGYQSVLDENWSEALERFREVQRQYPLTPGLMQLISSCLHELGQSEEALRSLTKASLVEPDNPGVQDQIQQIKLENALAAQTRRDWRQSIRLLEELVKADETHSGYWLNLGYSRQNMGRLTEAVAAYQKGLALDPDAGWARINLASSLYLLSRFDKARIEWERIIAKDETAEAYYQLGLCYSHLNREPEAEVAFEKAVTLGGETPELNYNLGITRLRLLRTQEGWTLIRRAALKGYAPALDMVRRAREKR